MNKIEAISNAIYIIENCANTHEPEVDETLKKLQQMLDREEYNLSKRRLGYGCNPNKNNRRPNTCS